MSITGRLDAFEEDIKRAEARVAGLRASAVSGQVARTTVLIVHRNEVDGPFELIRVSYFLDGTILHEQDNTDGKLAEAPVIQLYDGSLDPGQHKIEFELNFRGQAVGPFTYLEGYEFRVRSRVPKTFEVVDGQHNRIDVVATEKDDMTVEPQARLTVRLDVVQEDAAGNKISSPTAPDETPTTPPISTDN